MSQSKTKIMTEGAMMIALATVLSFVKVYQLPWGGSITLFSMLPIVFFSLKYGVKKGLPTAFLAALLQLGQGILDGLFAWGLTPLMLVSCILLDYLLPFTLLGTAGMFRKKGKPMIYVGVVIAMLFRFVCHFISGVVIWKSFGQLWGGFFTKNAVLYSLLYNGLYMLPEIITTTIAIIFINQRLQRLA